MQNEMSNSNIIPKEERGLMLHGKVGQWQLMTVYYLFYIKLERRAGVVVHACHPTTQEAEEGES